MKIQTKKQPGYIALITTLIAGAIALSLVISASISGIMQSRNGLIVQNIAEARSLSTTCAELALNNLRENASYTGNESINLGNGQCNILQIELPGGEQRVIKTSGSVNNLTKKTIITISQIDPQIIITSWQGVADF